MSSVTLAEAAWPARTGTGTDTGRSVLLCVVFSAITALAAQVSIPIPFTPVPITGQTFAVLLTGALLGPRLAFLTMLLYLAEGAAGLPVFAGGSLGWAKFVGPTGGYLISYPLAAALTGWLAQQHGWDRRPATALLAMLLGSVVIFALGAAWLSHFVGASKAFLLGVWPFVPGDLLKALLAAGLLPAGWKALGRRG